VFGGSDELDEAQSTRARSLGACALPSQGKQGSPRASLPRTAGGADDGDSRLLDFSFSRRASAPAYLFFFFFFCGELFEGRRVVGDMVLDEL